MHTKGDTKIAVDTNNSVVMGSGEVEKSPEYDPNLKKASKEDKENKGNKTRLLVMLILTFGYFLVEIIVGYATNSLALIGDSFHMLSDVIALIIAFVAVKISPKKWSQNTYGWARAEVLGALINAVFLLALCFTIIVDATQRIISGKIEIEDPQLILVVGTVGLLVNVLGLFIFRDHHGHGHSHGGNAGHEHSHSHSHHHGTHEISHHHHVEAFVPGVNDDKRTSVDLVNYTMFPPDNPKKEDHEEVDKERKNSSTGSQMNMHGVFLHVLTDALGSVVVIISALIIWLTDWEYKMYVDPILSLVIVILIMFSVKPLLVESAMVLLQTVPTHIQIDELKKKLLTRVQGAKEVHEFHIWQLSGNRIIASAHILCNKDDDFMRIGEEAKNFFHNEGIHSTTIQLEFVDEAAIRRITKDENCDSDFQDGDSSDTNSDCFLQCPMDGEAEGDCVSNTCCGVPKKKRSSAMSTAVTHDANNGTENASLAGINRGPSCDNDNANDEQRNATQLHSVEINSSQQ